MKAPERVIVVGASAGGVEALREALCELPSDLPAAIFVVLHVPPYQPSLLPKILSDCGAIRAVHPQDGAKIERGVIYVAPPDHHLLIESGRIAVKKGPKENRFRPSIDALFRSAAYSYRHNVIGVVLSGALDDGTSGLWSVKRLGGVAVIQQPDDARFDSMPKSALEYVDADFSLPSREIGALLQRLVYEKQEERHPAEVAVREGMGVEVEIAKEGNAFQKGFMKLGKLSPYTGPECHGAMVRILEGEMGRFRCHTGHAFTDSSLLEGVMEVTGQQVWQVMRSLEEGVMLLAEMATSLEQRGETERAKLFRSKAHELEKRSRAFHQVALDHESLSSDNLGRTVAST